MDSDLKDEDLTFIDEETLRIEQRRADIVAQVRNAYVLHLEIQNDNDNNMPLRMLRYYTDIRLATHLLYANM